MSVFITDSLLLPARRLPQLAVIAFLGWTPSAACLWMLLNSGVRLPNVESFSYDFYTSPQAAVLDLVVDPQAAVTWALAFAVSYLLGQVVVSGAFTDQVFRLSCGSPRPWYASLGRSLSRLYRTLPVFVFLVALLSVSLAFPLTAVSYLVWSGERSWQFLAAVAFSIFIPSALLSLWAYGRLSLMPAAAILAPRGTWSLALSVRATSGRWWSVMTRFVLVALIVGSVTSIIATPLSLLGLSGSTLVVTLALTGRVILSLASAALSTASLALVYEDSGSPAYFSESESAALSHLSNASPSRPPDADSVPLACD